MHLSSSGPTYPPSSLATDPYAKIPLSGGPGYTAEPQELPLQSSMPSVQLSMAAQDHQQPPIRTQYATYVQGSSAPPQLSLSTTTDNSLSVPRYMDSNSGRPSKSPRVAGHQSVHSSSSLATDPTSSEYRYGPSYVGGTSSEISPQTQHTPSSYGNPVTQDSGSAPTSSTAAAPPPRDYFPPSQSWTTTAGEPAASSVSYTNGSDQHRPYPSYSGGSHGASTKQESHHQQHGQPPQQGGPGGYSNQGQGLPHYSWNTT